MTDLERKMVLAKLERITELGSQRFKRASEPDWEYALRMRVLAVDMTLAATQAQKLILWFDLDAMNQEIRFHAAHPVEETIIPAAGNSEPASPAPCSE